MGFCWRAPSFIAQPGDTLNFGTLTLSSFAFGDGREAQFYGYPILIMAFRFFVSFFYTSFIQLNVSGSGSCLSFDAVCMANLGSSSQTFFISVHVTR